MASVSVAAAASSPLEEGGGPAAVGRPRRAGWHERRLAAALRRQHPEAPRRLHEQFGRMLYGYLVAALDDRGDAEDVLWQVLLEAWQRGPSYDPRRASLSTWLLLIARSRALDVRRKRVPEPTDPAIVSAARDRAAADDADELDRLLEHWRVVVLLARLPVEEREVLRLRFYRELSQREIAERTGMPLGTVKMRMVSGLERLRALLQAQESDR